MTTDQIRKLASLAIAISNAAPYRLKRPGYQCYIPHDLIKQIRAMCEDGGFDWRAEHRLVRGTLANVLVQKKYQNSEQGK